jgi:hypothetical protein
MNGAAYEYRVASHCAPAHPVASYLRWVHGSGTSMTRFTITLAAFPMSKRQPEIQHDSSPPEA